MGKVKKIVFLTAESHLRGGGEFVLREIIRGLKDKYKIFCVCKNGGDLADILKAAGAEILFCDLSWPHKVKRLPANYINLFFLSYRLKKISPGLIYANSGTINPFAVRLAENLGLPLITHLHDLFSPTAKDKYCLGRSNRVIAVSEAVAGLARPYNKNIKVIYNKIDAGKFSPALKLSPHNLKNKLGLSRCFLVGNVGTITYKKGYFEFVETARRTAALIPDVKFLIAGGAKPQEAGLLEEIKSRIRKYNLEDKFIFTGFINEPELAVAGLDVLLFPSHYEGFPRVVIESFACGTPIVSARWAGAGEIIEDKVNSFLFDIRDTEGMVQAIVRLYKDKELYNYISANAHKKFLDNFTLDKMSGEMAAVIEETISLYK